MNPSEAVTLEVARAYGFRYLSSGQCPDLATFHTDRPDDYDLVTGQSETHRRLRCPTCGYWVVWEPRTL